MKILIFVESKKMKTKKYLALLVLALMLFGLGGCSTVQIHNERVGRVKHNAKLVEAVSDSLAEMKAVKCQVSSLVDILPEFQNPVMMTGHPVLSTYKEWSKTETINGCWGPEKSITLRDSSEFFVKALCPDSAVKGILKYWIKFRPLDENETKDGWLIYKI